MKTQNDTLDGELSLLRDAYLRWRQTQALVIELFLFVAVFLARLQARNKTQY